MSSIRAATVHDAPAIRALLRASGWSDSKVEEAGRLEAMIARADRALVVVVDGHVVGFARALCDGVSNGYVSTFAIAPDHRGRGLARELLDALLGDDSRITWVLRAGHESTAFWEKMGFQQSAIAMERLRTR